MSFERVFVAEDEASVSEIALAAYREAFGEDAVNGIRFSDAPPVSDRFDLKSLADEGGIITLYRDSDVLDTWFSSALWPFATLGWPEEDQAVLRDAASTSSAAPQDERVGQNSVRPEEGSSAAQRSREPVSKGTSLLAKHYPNDLLISGFDILFFWDARMAMQGIHFMKEVPWKRLYLHGLVRAADGQKMSKSKGNVVDPLLLIDQYGADALRFFMAAMESQGRDVKMDEKRVEGYRNFATKLWNATRFAMSNGIGASASVEAPQASLAVNKWIIGEVVETVAALDKALAELRFDAAANAIYHFVWDQFCDWYLELIKPLMSLHGAAEALVDDDVRETKDIAGWVLDQILVMLHPFMPFITEELWHALGDRDYDLIVAKWPMPEAQANPIISFVDNEAVDAQVYMQWIIGTIIAVRAAKNEVGIAPGQRLTAYLEDVASKVWRLLPDARQMFERVGRLDIRFSEEAFSGGALRVAVPGATLVIPLEGVIDIAAEKARLAKALEAVSKEAKSLEGRLNNPSFVEKAKPEAVEKARADHAEKSAEAERLEAALKRLG